MTSRLGSALARRAGDVRAHPLVAATVLAIAVRIVAVAADKPKALAYLAACLVAVFAVDLLTAEPADGRRGETTASEPRLPVARPKLEFLVLGAMAFLGTLAALARVGVFDDFLARPLRIALVIGGMLCLMQVVPAFWLVARGYRAGALGARWTAARAGLACVAVVAAVALLVDAEGAPVVKVAQAGASAELALLLTTAPQVIAEEFLRMTLQTRIAAVTRNAALGWLLATLPWAALHVPAWIAGGDSLLAAFGGALRIVPIGLVWGFLTWRTGSLVPALIAHELNIFGLQNP